MTAEEAKRYVVGERVLAFDPRTNSGTLYQARVTEFGTDSGPFEGLVYLHYVGWSSRYDTWVRPEAVFISLEGIDIGATSDAADPPRLEVGQHVVAVDTAATRRRSGCKQYGATVLDNTADGLVTVQYPGWADVEVVDRSRLFAERRQVEAAAPTPAPAPGRTPAVDERRRGRTGTAKPREAWKTGRLTTTFNRVTTGAAVTLRLRRAQSARMYLQLDGADGIFLAQIDFDRGVWAVHLDTATD